MGIFTSNSIHSDEGTKIVHEAIKKAIVSIQKKYELQLAGIAEMGDKDNDDKYLNIGLCLVSKKQFSRNEGRKIVLDVSNILLENLNQEEVKPYLTVYPFTLKNIYIGITFSMAEKDRDYSQMRSCGIVFPGKLDYEWYNPSDRIGPGLREYETYEEALRLYKENPVETTPITVPPESERPKKRNWWSSIFG